MNKPANIKTTAVQLRILVIICIGILGITPLFKSTVVEGGVRNFAFVNLVKFLFQPTLTLDGPFVRSLRLFEQAVAYDPARYAPYQLRLKGLAKVFGKDNFRGDGGEWPPASLLAPSGARAVSRVGYYLRTIAEGPVESRTEAVQQLTTLFDANRERDDFGRYAYADTESPFSSFRVAFDRCPEFELMAIYVGEHYVATRQSIPIVFVWRIVAETSWEQLASVAPIQQNHSWEVRRDSDYLIQIGHATNQLFDGGFEQTVLPREGPPGLLPQALYARQAQQHTQLLYEVPGSGQNMVLELDGKGETPVGLGSLPLEIPTGLTGLAYLVTGRYRTDGEAAPRIGLRWLLKGAKKWDDNVSSYVVRAAADGWTSFAGILLPHPEAGTFQYWVLNANANSRLYVDNLGVFPISLPCMPK